MYENRRSLSPAGGDSVRAAAGCAVVQRTELLEYLLEFFHVFAVFCPVSVLLSLLGCVEGDTVQLTAVTIRDAGVVRAVVHTLKDRDGNERLVCVDSYPVWRSALGGAVEVTPDGLIIDGGRPLHGGTVDSYGDHRIAMAAAIAATVCSNPVTVTGADCVKKSYPRFWEEYRRLGGNYEQYLR